jgi:hypothetical protein
MPRRVSWRTWAFLAVVLALWLPRTLALDRFVTIDEPGWLAASGNFLGALVRGDLAATVQVEHPGVTTMWAGALGILWTDPDYARLAPTTFWRLGELETFLRGRGREPLPMLAAGRRVAVAATVGVVAAAFLVAARSLGTPVALMGFLLVAFDPFHLGLSRLLEPDALASSLVLLALLALGRALEPDGGARDLVVSGAAAGLAWLTKWPALVLLPFAALVLVGHRCRIWRFEAGGLRGLGRGAGALAAWTAAAGLTALLAWPGLWVSADRVAQMILRMSVHAAHGHAAPVFFDGRVIAGDPGPWFYPVSYLWRTTPVVLIGLGLALLALPGAAARPAERRMAGLLLAFVGVFTVGMALGAKKFDRYLLPVHAPLDLVAAMGFVVASRWLCRRWRHRAVRGLAAAALALAVVWQVGGTLATHPYYLSYYNPVPGGSARAPAVMMVGWGEGLDEAARYLRGKPGARELRVLSWYSEGPFSYVFGAPVGHLDGSWSPARAREVREADYVVLYVNQWQRGYAAGELRLLAPTPPEHVVVIDGLEYARVYAVDRLRARPSAPR